MYCMAMAFKYKHSIKIQTLRIHIWVEPAEGQNKTHFINLLICCLHRPIYIFAIKEYINPNTFQLSVQFSPKLNIF